MGDFLTVEQPADDLDALLEPSGALLLVRPALAGGCLL
jgi:hypothetical protein